MAVKSIQIDVGGSTRYVCASATSTTSPRSAPHGRGRNAPPGEAQARTERAMPQWPARKNASTRQASRRIAQRSRCASAEQRVSDAACQRTALSYVQFVVRLTPTRFCARSCRDALRRESQACAAAPPAPRHEPQRCSDAPPPPPAAAAASSAALRLRLVGAGAASAAPRQQTCVTPPWSQPLTARATAAAAKPSPAADAARRSSPARRSRRLHRCLVGQARVACDATWQPPRAARTRQAAAAAAHVGPQAPHLRGRRAARGGVREHVGGVAAAPE
jgi:hypothetical protein